MSDNIELIYQLYKSTKNLIESAKACCEKDHSEDPAFKHFQDAIEIFDGLDRGYAERYEEEKKNELSK